MERLVRETLVLSFSLKESHNLTEYLVLRIQAVPEIIYIAPNISANQIVNH